MNGWRRVEIEKKEIGVIKTGLDDRQKKAREGRPTTQRKKESSQSRGLERDEEWRWDTTISEDAKNIFF